MPRSTVIILLLSVFAAGGLLAQLDFFERHPRQLALFASEESPARAEGDTGRFALSFWLSPFLRATTSPDGLGPGAGLEFAYFLSQEFGLAAGVAAWSISVPVNDWRGTSEQADGYELTLGARWRFYRWPKGCLYTEARGVFGEYDGFSPIRQTQSLGAGVHFGYEFGKRTVSGFMESGLGFRFGLNYSDAGWVFTGYRRGIGGLHIDIFRIGMRVYL
jgi:hypothetical protein